jgi:hypothetical protein
MYGDTHAYRRCHTPVGPSLSYIFEMHGKLSMVVGFRWLSTVDPFFKVFKLVDIDDDAAYKHKWAEVTSLGDYALYIGAMRSKAVHVSVEAENYGLKRNHIYYAKYTYFWIKNSSYGAVYSVTSNDGDRMKMYCKKDQSYNDSMERTGYYVTSSNYAMWIHPPDL